MLSLLLSFHHPFILLQPSHSAPNKDISDSIAVVGTIGDHTSDHMPDLPTSSEPIAMLPKLINLNNLPLHSPSSEIVGTPFANDNTRFEYPFPCANQTCGSGSSSVTSGPTSPSTSPSSSSFPALSTSSQMLKQLSFPPPSHRPSYNVTHPKLKVQADPPVPPNLLKRRLRWNLSLLGRKKSISGSQQSMTSDESITPNFAHGQEIASPPGSPIQERVKH